MKNNTRVLIETRVNKAGHNTDNLLSTCLAQDLIVAYYSGSCSEDYKNYALFSSLTDRLVVPTSICINSGGYLSCRSGYRQ
ncbi:hypothetical protein VspSTUT16_07830 [Vibrio sp. STUT-A16]|nr:hypothetical protein VspSTUT16_07830 [Vibrio sp. STUT-A16]